MVKYFIVILLFIGMPLSGFSQTDFQVKSLAAFCKVWGFLKYYHPSISQKNLNWDSTLLVEFPKVCEAKTKAEFSNIMLGIVDRLGIIPAINEQFKAPDSLSMNADFRWMNDTSEFIASLSNYLTRIRLNKVEFRNKYVKSSRSSNAEFTENPYEDSIYPRKTIRFLALARYWNIINYYFPDKYLMDDNWDSSLVKAIPLFLNASNSEEYFKAIKWITARTNDSHALFVYNPHFDSIFFSGKLPFDLFYHNDTLVVTHLFNDSLCSLLDIDIGDIILSVNNNSINQYWKEIQEYYSASNAGLLEYRADWLLIHHAMEFTPEHSIEVEILRNQHIVKRTLKMFPSKSFQKRLNRTTNHSDSGFAIFTDTVSRKKYGYMDMSTLKNPLLFEYLKRMKNISYLILDFRHGDNGLHYSLPYCFFSGKKHIWLITCPDYIHPGYYKHLITEPVNSLNDQPYEGKVIILDEHANQSSDEFAIMLYQQAANAIIIGTQTSGADGNVSTVIFPGGYSVNFSGLGIYYPDGKETQRIGIVPDIKVDYTIYTSTHHIDPIFNRAIEYIRTGN